MLFDHSGVRHQFNYQFNYHVPAVRDARNKLLSFDQLHFTVIPLYFEFLVAFASVQQSNY